MPVHDADLYYRIPGQLPAQDYTEFADMDIMVTKRPDLLITSTAAGATVGYNIQVDQAGRYQLGLRVLATGAIDVMENDHVLATATGKGDQVEMLTVPVDLPAGPQTLQLRLSAPGQVISSLKFSR